MPIAKILILFTVLFSTVAWGKEPAATKSGPCRKVIDACKSAGFARSDRQDRKGLFKNCMRPIMRGESVEGVKVSSADIEACRAKKRTMPSFK